MTTARHLALVTALAAALGGVVGVVSIVVRDAATSATSDQPGDARGGPAVRGVVPGNPDPGAGHAPDRENENAATADRVRSLTQRIDSPEESERHALALELLRRGPIALPQAQALRPQSKAGRDLQARTVTALQKMRALRRGGDYVRLERHLRLRLDLDAFATVIPDEALQQDRLDYWRLALDAVRSRAEGGLAKDGEVALAELELARVQRELGELDGTAYGELVARRLPACQLWIDGLRQDRGVAPARVRALEEQVARLAVQ